MLPLSAAARERLAFFGCEVPVGGFACYSACKIGSDSVSMKFAGGVALISMENQRHASTSAALLTGAQRLRRRDGGP
jgi:hypothetical protein